MTRSALAYAAFLLAFFVTLDGLLGGFAASRDRSFRTAHPYYHHGLRPGRSAQTVWAGRPYGMRTNSLGFRDAAPARIEPRPRGRRTLLIGDSMVEGLGVEHEHTAAGRLAARGRTRGVEVLNAGVVSYSPKLYDLRTRWLVAHEGVELQRLVVLLDVSDIHDELNYEAFVPREQLAPGERALEGWRRRSLVAQLWRRFDPEARQIDNRFIRDAEIHLWMRTVDAYRDATGNPDAGRWEWTHDEAAFRAWGERGLALAEANMASLAAFCREHAIELVIAVFPSPYQIFADELDSRQVAFWQGFCEREQVKFLNLFPAFIDPRRLAPLATYERYFIPDDVHWNEAGHAFVADQIEEAVLGSAGR
jgi:hypothetical protein